MPKTDQALGRVIRSGALTPDQALTMALRSLRLGYGMTPLRDSLVQREGESRLPMGRNRGNRVVSARLAKPCDIQRAHLTIKTVRLTHHVRAPAPVQQIAMTEAEETLLEAAQRWVHLALFCCIRDLWLSRFLEQPYAGVRCPRWPIPLGRAVPFAPRTVAAFLTTPPASAIRRQTRVIPAAPDRDAPPR